MTLIELLENLDTLDDGLTIYAEAAPDWRPSSLAMVYDEAHQNSSMIPASMKYLLEVSLGKEVLDVWQQWHGGAQPSIEEKWAAVIYYAINDAFISD